MRVSWPYDVLDVKVTLTLVASPRAPRANLSEGNGRHCDNKFITVLVNGWER